MIGRVYAWHGGLWRVIAAPPKIATVRKLGYAVPKGTRFVRNVLVERVFAWDQPPERAVEQDIYNGIHTDPDGRDYWRGRERTVRPFRGLRRPA